MSNFYGFGWIIWISGWFVLDFLVKFSEAEDFSSSWLWSWSWWWSSSSLSSSSSSSSSSSGRSFVPRCATRDQVGRSERLVTTRPPLSLLDPDSWSMIQRTTVTTLMNYKSKGPSSSMDFQEEPFSANAAWLWRSMKICLILAHFCT